MHEEEGLEGGGRGAPGAIVLTLDLPANLLAEVQPSLTRQRQLSVHWNMHTSVRTRARVRYYQRC